MMGIPLGLYVSACTIRAGGRLICISRVVPSLLPHAVPGISAIRAASVQKEGIEPVIDKDRTAAALALALSVDVLLMPTDIEAVLRDCGGIAQARLDATSPSDLDATDRVPDSMVSRAASAGVYVCASGGVAGIGQL